MAKEKKPRGRPRTHDRNMKQIAIRLPQGVIEELDRIVEDEMGAVDRSTLVRQAVVDFIKKKGRPE